ncbi:MAG: hypothetical protein QM817_07865 [Archangium sp.]
MLLGASCAAPTPECLELPDELDFGEQPAGIAATKTVVFSNPRGSPRVLSIDEIEPPFGPEGARQITILAGGEQRVSFTFVPQDGRLQLGEAILRGGEACEPHRMELRGLGAGRVVVLERPTFPATPIGSEARSELVLFNGRRVEVPAEVEIFAQADGSPATFSAPPITQLAPNAITRIPVTFRAERDGVMSVQASVSTGDMRNRLVLTAMGGVPRVELSRTSLHAGLVAIGSEHVRHVYLRNAGDGALEVRALQVIAGAGSTADELQIAGPLDALPRSREAQLRLSFRARSPGPRTWTVVIETNAPTAPKVALEVSARFDFVSVCVAPLDATVSPLEITGPYPRTALLSIHNPGTTPCLLEGPEFDTFTDWRLELPSSEDDSVVVNAGATVALPLYVAAPGTRFVRWQTFKQRASEVLVIAQ